MATAFKTADILLPANEDLCKWSVVACDQYTSEPEYWEETDRIIGDAPSARKLILPEVYLGADDVDSRISDIHKTMDEYTAKNIFKEYKNSMIYIERMTSDGIRAGIVGAIDLEEYDYNKGSTSSVRATEATVTSRIPPRIKVRNGASLELPHIMILIDDENKTVVEKITAKKDSLEKIYDTDLMQNGGHITGYLLGENDIAEVEKALDLLGDSDAFNKKYGTNDLPVLLYAMGDGNHSLATAKEYYEMLKKQDPDKDMSDHPARYALAEIVNLHSEALKFEAIHRIVTDIDTDKFMSELREKLGCADNGTQCFTAVLPEGDEIINVTKPTSNLTVGTLQQFIDEYIAENGGDVDYIHGEDVIRKLVAHGGSVGFILPDMGKDELFPTVIKDGALPRKTFSMGHANDKRFYMEARKITD